jgi:hypothetical protein
VNERSQAAAHHGDEINDTQHYFATAFAVPLASTPAVSQQRLNEP